MVLEEPEVKLQLWTPDVTCALRHEGEEATNTPMLTTGCRIFLFLSPARAPNPTAAKRSCCLVCDEEMEPVQPGEPTRLSLKSHPDSAPLLSTPMLGNHLLPISPL